MHNLGQTRSACRASHYLFTPDTFVRAPLPGMTAATAIVHVSPAAGAAFTQYTVEFEAGGALGPSRGQRFLYVTGGELSAGGRVLAAGHYAFFPEGCDAKVSARGTASAAVIEKQYRALEGTNAPAMLFGDESAIAAAPLNGDAGIALRCLLPDQPAFDFAVNTMTYEPGAALSQVEIHVMEHGLAMLQGGGIYRLDDAWYPVSAGDFIWMAPYCPQWFGALGKTPAKYLIYKDWNRHPLP
ncbi:MAG TPA: (S)-ureidoglycine aminohydrolase [Candidatus Limnocylindrales bacterium]|nr:(S)-ureidoglycine aminohydrolase [Candidatus Limnocylindrales bacterium]